VMYLIYCKNFYKCHNVSHTQQFKKKVERKREKQMWQSINMGKCKSLGEEGRGGYSLHYQA
jgi:hypothetical protein